MRKMINAVAMASMAVGLGLAQTSNQTQTPADSSRQPMFFQFEDLRWEKITTSRGDCTFELANVRIDPKTKATALMIRHPAKCYVPKHWHTANEMITVISGTFVLECAGKQGALRRGSTGYVPAQMIHRAWTTSNEDALYLVQVDAAWDVNWVKDTSNPPNVPKP